jgi:PTS system cellobiose-specific IIB component
MKRITLICAAGMSTSLMVSQMNLAAIKTGADVKIRAVPESAFPKYENETDILMLGPQIGYLLKEMKAKYEPMGIKVTVINSVDYGTMNGEKVLKAALSM